MKRAVRPRGVVAECAEAGLEACFERVRGNPAQEPVFFRRLLDAAVYVHVPASDDSGKVRLVQFRHPDGFDAIPFFTSLAKAQIAGSSAVRILPLLGRDLLAGTRGATLMLNPNDGGAVLYPEEIATLLDTGFMARVEKVDTAERLVRPAQGAPAWLGPTLNACLQPASFVSAAYLLETSSSETSDQPPGLLIWLVADMAFADRAARLVTTAIQPLCANLDFVIDLAIHDAGQPLPDHLDQPDLAPVFQRRTPPDATG